MTPEEGARIAVPCFGPPHCTGNDHDYECDRHDPERFNRAVEQIGAALRERDAAHEIALKKARADALNAAADLVDEEADADEQTALDCRNCFRPDLAKECEFAEERLRGTAKSIRALLEEAGK